MSGSKQITCEGINWIDVLNPTNAEVVELSYKYDLNRNIVQDSLQPEHLPKYEFVDDVHFNILRYYAPDNEHPSTIQELTNKITIFYTEEMLITIHKTEANFLEPIRNRCKTPGKCVTTTEVIAKIAWSSLQSFEDRANYLSGQVDIYESEIIHGRIRKEHMEKLYLVKREASLAHKVIMLMQEPINHLFFLPGEETMIQDVKDQHLKIKTMYGQLVDEVNNLVNLLLSFSSHKTNEVMKVLTIFSAFFLPLTFIAGIYGMNFEWMPELHYKWGYPSALLVMLIITIGIYAWFRRKGWL